MAADPNIASLKRQLVEDVATLFHRNAMWKEPILEVLDRLRTSNVRAVLFGGTLRSLMVSRIFERRFGRPRDVDVVVAGAPLSDLEERFKELLNRHTRFGGLHLRRGGWQFDVWPVSETWAFKQGHASPATFAQLPSTTPFNLEAIAVEVWPGDGRSRMVFSGDDQFFEGILSRTIELNRSDNPFPDLTVVRALVMAAELRFRIGPRLAAYIRDVAPSLTEAGVDQIQSKHYGHSRIESRTLMDLVAHVSRHEPHGKKISLPPLGQLRLWQTENEDDEGPRLNVHLLGVDRERKGLPM